MLSPSQFKPVYTSPGGMALHKMSRVMQMDSLDVPGTEVRHGLLPVKQGEVAEGSGDTHDYGALTDAMREGGPAAIPPVQAGPASEVHSSFGGSAKGAGDQPMLGNGGHRVAIAHDLGWRTMPVTSDLHSSGYGDMSHNDGTSAGLDSWDDEDDHMPGNTDLPSAAPHKPSHTWMKGGNALGDPGLHTVLHGAQAPLQSAQFNVGEPKLPGMGLTLGGGFAGGNAGDPGAGETSWPGGGRIMTGDR